LWRAFVALRALEVWQLALEIGKPLGDFAIFRRAVKHPGQSGVLLGGLGVKRDDLSLTAACLDVFPLLLEYPACRGRVR